MGLQVIHQYCLGQPRFQTSLRVYRRKSHRFKRSPPSARIPEITENLVSLICQKPVAVLHKISESNQD